MSAKAKTPGPSPKAGGPFRDVQRGTQDEMEILGLIVAMSPNIRQVVLDQVRKAKKRMQDREKKAGPVAE